MTPPEWELACVRTGAAAANPVVAGTAAANGEDTTRLRSLRRDSELRGGRRKSEIEDVRQEVRGEPDGDASEARAGGPLPRTMGLATVAILRLPLRLATVRTAGWPEGCWLYR